MWLIKFHKFSINRLVRLRFVLGRLLLISSGSAALGGVCSRSLPVGEAASAGLVIEYGREITKPDERGWVRPRNEDGKGRHVPERRVGTA